ncbi:hypothetical protein Tco_0277413, partial [Tanacetum coccineum]
EKVPSELKRAIMQGRTDKKLTQAQLAQMINEKPQIIQETISTTEVFLAAEFPTFHVVEPSPIIITPSSITAPMPDLLNLGLSGEDNSAICGAETYGGPNHDRPVGYTNDGKSRLLDQLTVANIHSHTRLGATTFTTAASYEMLSDHVRILSPPSLATITSCCLLPSLLNTTTPVASKILFSGIVFQFQQEGIANLRERDDKECDKWGGRFMQKLMAA